MITCSALSDVGRKRQVNQDFFLTNPDSAFYILADGMGGHSAGEVASKATAASIDDFVSMAREPHEMTWPFGYSTGIPYEHNVLQTAIRLANLKIAQLAEQQEQYAGMGSTMVLAWIRGFTAFYCHVGDSRLYLFRRGILKPLTEDETLVQELLRRGLITPEEARRHEMRHVVTRAIGTRGRLEVQVREQELQSGDVLFLCSDGVTDRLPDDELCRKLASGADLDAVCRLIVDSANEAGGDDNITAMLLRFGA